MNSTYINTFNYHKRNHQTNLRFTTPICDNYGPRFLRQVEFTVAKKHVILQLVHTGSNSVGSRLFYLGYKLSQRFHTLNWSYTVTIQTSFFLLLISPTIKSELFNFLDFILFCFVVVSNFALDFHSL